MKFGQILVYLIANISNMSLAQCWRLETSSRPFYDFNKMAIFNSLLFTLSKKWNTGNLKLVSAIFSQFFIFRQIIALQKLWKVCFISPKKLFSFLRYSDFCIFFFSSFFPCQPLLYRLIEEKSKNLWCYQLSKYELDNIFCLISSERNKLCHWNFVHW